MRVVYLSLSNLFRVRYFVVLPSVYTGGADRTNTWQVGACADHLAVIARPLNGKELPLFLANGRKILVKSTINLFFSYPPI
jgi:hypothetical protein